MRIRRLTVYLIAAALLTFAPAAWAGESLTLQAVQFPEDRDTDIDFARVVDHVPGDLHGEVEFERGRADVRLKAKNMKPALALGGDVTTYVVWAAPRSGDPENLGELAVRDDSERFHFTSGLKEMAILVTAESHPRVEQPSSLVLFHNLPTDERGARNHPFTISEWAAAPRTDGDHLRALPSDEKCALAVMQAREIFEIVEARNATHYAPDQVRDAKIALGQAQNYFEASKEDLAIDYARRSVAASSSALLTRENQLRLQAEAARQAAVERERASLEARAEVAENRSDALQRELTATEREKLGLQQQIALRESQLTELGQSAAMLAQEQAEAKADLAQAKAQLEALDMDRRDARQEAERLKAERERLSGTVAELAEQQKVLHKDREALMAEKGELETQNEQLARQKRMAEEEKAKILADLEGSLSKIAETRSTARGLVVSLPDILFDVDKATLKPNASHTLARLAGVLLLVPEVQLSVEGHTDSTGTEKHNDWLADARAESVSDFLIGQGVDSDRLETEGFGEHQPIADNTTRAGRQQNRRVEVVLERNAADAGDTGVGAAE